MPTQEHWHHQDRHADRSHASCLGAPATTTRLGIPLGRDEHLPYRFVDHAYAPFCTRNPLGRTREEGRDYILHHADAAPWKHC